MAGLNHQVRGGELDPRIGCALPRARAPRSFQNIPIKMKKPISIRKVTLMMATIRNASPADREFMTCLASCEVPKPNSPKLEMFRFPRPAARRGGAKAIPINLHLMEVMGFAALYPSYALVGVPRAFWDGS
jgi:hypothetical protein